MINEQIRDKMCIRDRSNPLSGYLYVRNIGEYYAVLAAVSDPAGEPDIQAVLSTLSEAR